MANPSRMESKMRLHKRPQCKVNTLISEDPGPYKTVVKVSGRLPRQDFKSYPYFAGVGAETWFIGAV